MPTLPVSIYFMWEWWDAYYHNSIPRPATPSDDALDAMYLGRQRFLFDKFDGFALGHDHPVMDGFQVNSVVRWGFDLVPVLLGVTLECIEAGGWNPRPLDDAQAWQLQPVDIQEHPEGEWLAREIARKRARYGSVAHCIDLGSVMNNAFRLRGQEIYLDLLLQPELAQHLFEVILATERSLYGFLQEHFPTSDPVPVSNCNVTLLSPQVYLEQVLPFDIRQSQFVTEFTGAPASAAVHHCDVQADPFLAAYAQLPGLASLQASIATDIAQFKTYCPTATFSAMLNPGMLADTSCVQRHLRKALMTGVHDLCLWNIDPTVSPAHLATLLQMIRTTCGEFNCEPLFTALPFCWDELEWAFPRYQQG